MYLHVNFSTTQISALLDSGSSINLMSRELFDRLPHSNKVHVDHCHESIVLANNQHISIDYIAQVKGIIGSRQQSFNVYVLKDTAHPLILGTEYMRNNGVTLNFDTMSVNAASATVRSRKRILLEPNSETIIWGKTPKFLSPGLEGVCSGSAHVSKKCLFVARSLSVVSSDQMVPFKVLNPTTQPVTIHKNKPLGAFQIMDHSFDVTTAEQSGQKRSLPQPDINASIHRPATSHTCQNVNTNTEKCKTTADTTRSLDRERFLSNFHHSSTALPLSSDENCRLNDCLVSNHDLFVTEENPSLGLTSVVEPMTTRPMTQ